VLLVAQLSPPSEIVAARRIAGLAKFLAQLGHDVTVLSSIRSGRGGVEGAATVKTRDLAATRMNWKVPQSTGGATAAPTARVSGIEAHAVPDIAVVTWLPFLVPKALALAHSKRFDCAITSSPPASTHLLGPLLQRLGVRWIADLRDGWTHAPPRPPWPLAAEARLDGTLERALLTRADAVVGVTSGIVDDLSDRLGVDGRLIPNGYDPAERKAGEWSAASDLLSPQRHSLVHTGRASMSERSPAVVFDALRHLLRSNPPVVERLEVVFAGPVSAAESDQLSDPALRRVTRSVGMLDRRRTLALQQAADSLLVITAGPRERTLATGKLFEYLTAGPPILVVGDRSEAASIVAATGTGIAVPADSPHAVAAGIERLIEGVTIKRNQEAIDRYSWENLATLVSGLIDEVCDQPPVRARRGRR
jgi:glycosyltransferase involved in cell wall biosynthesis